MNIEVVSRLNNKKKIVKYIYILDDKVYKVFQKCTSKRISDRHKQRSTIPLSSIVFQMSNYCSGRPDSLLSERSFVFLHR